MTVVENGEASPLLAQQPASTATYSSVAGGKNDRVVSAPREEAVGEEPGDVVKPQVSYKTFSQIWAVCLALWVAIFCSAMSATIVANVQMQVASEFGAGSMASWLGTAFLLGVTAVNPLCGRLVDMMGSGNCFGLASSLFLVGTVLCGLAPSMGFVLGARVVAGIGSGGLNTFAAIILAKLVSPADRGLYQGGSSVLQAAGSAVGAVLGGAVADAWGWRVAFWLQVPPIALTVLVAFTKIKLDEPKSSGSAWSEILRVDWAGWFFLFFSVVGVTIGLTFHNEGRAWTHPLVCGLLIASASSLVVFVWVESKVKAPLLPVQLLRRSQVVLLLWANMPLTAMWFARVYFQPVYLQISRDMDATHSGAITLPFTVIAAVISVYAGWHMRYFKEYKWFQTIAPAFSWLQALSVIQSWSISTNETRLWMELAAAGIGAIPYTTLTTALVLAVDHDEIALVVSATYVFRAMGQVWGLAIGAAIQQSMLASSLARRLPQASPSTIYQIINSPITFLPIVDAAVKLQARLAYFESIQGVFGFIAGLGVILSALCLGVRPLPL